MCGEMQDLEKLGRSLQESGKAEGIKALAESAEGQALGRRLDAKAIQDAARRGDSDALRAMLRQVLETDEGRRLADNVRRLMEK